MIKGDIAQFSYLWDGSKPGWYLVQTSHVEWVVVISFNQQGITLNEVKILRHIIPELRLQKLPAVLTLLRKQPSYRTAQTFGNIEARELTRRLSSEGIQVELESRQLGGYLPMSTDGYSLVIEDDALAQRVYEKMLAENVRVELIHVD